MSKLHIIAYKHHLYGQNSRPAQNTFKRALRNFSIIYYFVIERHLPRESFLFCPKLTKKNIFKVSE